MLGDISTYAGHILGNSVHKVPTGFERMRAYIHTHHIRCDPGLHFQYSMFSTVVGYFFNLFGEKV